MTELQKITLRDVFRQQGLSERRIEDAMVYAQRQAIIDEYNAEDFPWEDFWEFLEEQGGAR